MYLVRFVRKDKNDDKEYYYHHLADALYHFSLFSEDDSDLYLCIHLLELNNFEERTLSTQI